MEMETQGNESTGSENSVSTGSETSGSESASSVMPDDPSLAEKSSETDTPQEKAAAAAKTVYTPNFKFKVLDKEQEIDEWLRPVIKDAETEKKVKELYEKAYGLDYVKKDRQSLREQYQTTAQEVQHHRNVVNNVNEMLAKKDYDNLFGNVLKIPEDDILRQAQKILQLREMPPEQRQAYESHLQAKQRLSELESQNQYLSQTYEQTAVHARTQELDWTLQRPEFSAVASQYDARLGEGAFRQAVIERGKYHALANGQDISPEQAVQEVLRFLGGPQAFQPSPQAPGVMQQSPQPVAPQRPPVITNIQGRGTSPAKKVVKSLDDLKKRAKELAEA